MEMKITEKLYIKRLEGMVKKYKNDPCKHCPMIKYYGIDMYMIGSTRYSGGRNDICNMCRELIARYNDFENKEELLTDRNIVGYYNCPCTFCEKKVFSPEKVPEGYMIKVAWNTIHG